MATVHDVLHDVHSKPFDLVLLDDATLDVLCEHIDEGAPGEPLLPFADWLEVQAQMMRLKKTPTACWLSARIVELASWARRLKADTPTDFDARFGVEEEARLTEIWVSGWDACERRMVAPESGY